MTFFSGTDLATLQEEGDERNHFVSLIVNNAGTYTAAITRKIKYSSVISISYEGFEGTVNDGTQETVEGEEIEYFDLKIEFESTENQFPEVEERLKEIKKAKPTWYVPNNNAAVKPITYSPSLPKDNAVQGTLFQDESWEYPGKSWGSPVVQTVNGDRSMDSLVHSIVSQLITGNVTYTKGDPGYMKKALDSMEKRFDARFGSGDQGALLFEYWATDFIEFLTWYSIDDGGDTTISADQLTAAIVEELAKLPSTNKYIDKYNEILTSYADKF